MTSSTSRSQIHALSDGSARRIFPSFLGGCRECFHSRGGRPRQAAVSAQVSALRSSGEPRACRLLSSSLNWLLCTHADKGQNRRFLHPSQNHANRTTSRSFYMVPLGVGGVSLSDTVGNSRYAHKDYHKLGSYSFQYCTTAWFSPHCIKPPSLFDMEAAS